MASPNAGRIALMSIHPEFCDAILDGRKLVEFRKRRLADDVSHVVIYATAPVSRLVGTFRVAGQQTSTPDALWRRFKHVGGIERGGFLSYYGGRDAGTAIEVADVHRFAAPKSLPDTLGIDRPPQSFQYLAEPARALLRELDIVAAE